MQEFKIAQEELKPLRKKGLILNIVIGLIVIGSIYIQGVWTEHGSSNDYLPYTLAFLVVLFSFSYYRGRKKQNRFLDSYLVRVSDEGVTREQLNTPPLTISFMEIKEIVKTEKGGFIIRGRGRRDTINIPYVIEKKDVLEESLQKLAPITYNKKDPFGRKYRLVLLVVALGMLICVYTLKDKVIVGICGTCLTALMIWAFYEIQVSKNVSQNMKRKSWIYLLLLLSVLFVTIMKVTGNWA